MNAQVARRRRPSAAMIVSLVALFVALSDSGNAATIVNLVLGKTNHATRPTGIAAPTKGPVLAVTNTGTGAAGSFTVKRGGAQPFTVNSSTKIKGLNADLLDGQDSGRFWNLGGNAGTNPTADFLGTTDAQPLVVRTDNTEALRIDAAGDVMIGTALPTSKLTVATPGPDTGVAVTSTGTGTGIEAQTDTGNGVAGTSPGGNGVAGASTRGRGVQGTSSAGVGVIGDSATGRGVIGTLGGIPCPGVYAVGGCGGSTGDGVQGYSTNSHGVSGTSVTSVGVYGNSQQQGVVGTLGFQCAYPAAVAACGGTKGNGLVAETSHLPGGSTAAAVYAINVQGGDIFIGEANGARRARIDGAGKAYFDGGTQTGGADYADSLRADSAATLRPGDVLAIDPTRGNTVGLARVPFSTLVAGVYSTKPAVLGVGDHRLGDSLRGQVPVALVGIVPTHVSAANGPVHAGDLLTTSSIPGYAMKATPVMVNGVAVYPAGTILGKAMQPLASGRGTIRVLVTLR